MVVYAFEMKLGHKLALDSLHWHDLALEKVTTSSLIVYFVTNHIGCIEMAKIPRSPKMDSQN